MATAPAAGFPYFTPSNGGNNVTFVEGPGGFLGISNPFTINKTSAWTVSLIRSRSDRSAC